MGSWIGTNLKRLAALMALVPGAAAAADLGPPPVVAPPPPAWTTTFVPYGWLTALNGTQTVRGRTVKVDASFSDIVEASDSIVALMGDLEVRRGQFSFIANFAWSKIGFSGGGIRERDIGPNATTTVGRNIELDIEMAILEAGATWEALRAGPVALDVLGGVRYWYQEADLSFQAVRGIDVGDLEVVGGLAFAKSGSVDWLDPYIGARVRYEVTPGHRLFVRGDIGGFSVGSRFSWQAIAGYAFDIGSWNGIEFSGILGYRALAADYSQGSGRTRYEFDIVQHGPVVGVALRF